MQLIAETLSPIIASIMEASSPTQLGQNIRDTIGPVPSSDFELLHSVASETFKLQIASSAATPSPAHHSTGIYQPALWPTHVQKAGEYEDGDEAMYSDSS